MDSYLTHLECTFCKSSTSADKATGTCPKCGKVLFAKYDLDKARRHLDREILRHRDASMWRYFEVLPVRDNGNVVTLGEGFTPLSRVKNLGNLMGLTSLYIKDEGLNPTGTFKARGLSAAVSRATELGLVDLSIPSAGNAGAALAAYASRAGINAYIFMPRDAPEATRKEVIANEAHLTLVDGLIDNAGKCSQKASAEKGLFDVSTLKEPYRLEGKKTMGYEIAEQMEWSLPDAIIYPTGGGTGIIGMWKAFDEMEHLGWIGSNRPRMYCVQAEGCGPIVKAFNNGSDFAEPWQNARSIAAGLRVPIAIGDYLILRVLRESQGKAVTVTDQSMLDYMRSIASSEGILVSPEGAATAAGAAKLLTKGSLAADDKVVLLNTGSGLKHLDLV